VASDGYYMLALAKEQQAFFLGIRSTFYRLSMLTGNGLIVILAGFLENKFGDNTKAWSYTMIVVALIAISLTIYNFFSTPKVEENTEAQTVQKTSFSEIFTSFFQKKQIGIAVAFILLFRLGESQLLKMLTPFLIDDKTKGGMGLATEDVGIIYGTFGVIALVIGGILGGIVISKEGLRKWMLRMFLAMHLPIIGFVFLAYFHPTSVYYIYAAVIAEQFGYGFGFAAFMMYLIYIADGESKTSHYAIATGFMALGMMIPGMASGFIQEYLGYGNFFIWVFCATVPGLILSQYLDYPDEYGKKMDENNSLSAKK
jgi:PAT family beta-lactamase induction signal transducer AmpG